MGALEKALEMIEVADPEKTLPLCGIKAIEIGSEALNSVTAITQQFIPTKSTVAVVADKTIIRRQGLDAKKIIRELVSQFYTVQYVELDDGHSELHASEEVIAESVRRCEKVDGIISIGGGTITDIGKMTSVALNGIPHVAIQTAASVDGYTDNVSVILINGVKRTVPSRWPEAVIADTTLIAEAPQLMNKAGYGEINSMFTAPADWRIAAILGFEKKFHWGPIQLLHGVGEGIEEWSPGVKNSEIRSTEHLVNALAVRGIVTGVADTTACLSGIEHLISHMLDMSQTAQHKQVGQHGAQVGVGSIYAAAIWDLIFTTFEEREINTPPLLDNRQLQSKVINAFDHMDSTGALAAECWNDYSKKVDYWVNNRDSISQSLRSWKNYSNDLRSLIKTPEEIALGLISAGSPTTFDELEPSFSEEIARWSISNCHLMRNRFVGIDLLDFLGLWNESTIDWVWNRSARALAHVGVSL
jgi:glycerol-1-phosphate dehydrogenase [NAD(P)+]